MTFSTKNTYAILNIFSTVSSNVSDPQESCPKMTTSPLSSQHSTTPVISCNFIPTGLQNKLYRSALLCLETWTIDLCFVSTSPPNWCWNLTHLGTWYESTVLVPKELGFRNVSGSAAPPLNNDLRCTTFPACLSFGEKWSYLWKQHTQNTTLLKDFKQNICATWYTGSKYLI